MAQTRTVRPDEDLAALVWELPSDTIVTLEPGTHRGPVVLERPITLRAAGPGVILDAGGRGPVVAVSALDGAVTLDGLTLQGGVDGEAGGAVRATGGATVTLQGCTLRGCRGGSHGGGAVFANDGEVTLLQCQLLDNRAERGGAALLADGTARVRLVGSVVAGNDAGRGAVLRASDGAQVTLLGTTIVDNVGAAALSADGTLTRAPELLVSGCIIDHGEGPILGGDRQPPRPALRFERSVLRGRPPLLDTAAGNVVGDPELDPASTPRWRPSPTSPARGLWLSPTGPDLLGNPRPIPATAGALE